ncbi:uncharacterized protein N7496_006087 [Penicillium cataractarum]|uniref:F-box domain-containing protein n=1 Tax=Penicillium cataractarum TaxID=2100454 RepID=A0A9W9S144_9EURO|nr:uncharacterized protein N7496_006087 [Penicillium cataractarum]KAJ5369995.1 hypothetical protein N7496_006087 [Penicillium cataractarum]
MLGAPSLTTIPFDVFYMIVTFLDGVDYVHLSHTNSTLYLLLDNDLITRKIVEKELAYSKEGRAALIDQSGYRSAILHRFKINEAVATATPYAVAMLAFATDFLFQQGILCYQVEHEIRLLDVHHGGRRERLLDLHEIIPRLDSGLVATGLDPINQVTLLYFKDEILVFRIEGSGGQNSWLIAIDTALQQTRRKRLLLQRPIPSSTPIFVRHTRSYLWYGTFTATHGSQGRWVCYGVDMATNEFIAVDLDCAVDWEIGRTLCFDMYQDHLYAVSTLPTTDGDENHSFYHWSCYSPRQKDQKWSGLIWRREHREGPINEMWMWLSIQFDESTGRPTITECRREWPNGSSENYRTHYFASLYTPAELRLKYPSWRENFNEAIGGPENRPKNRLQRYYHPEYENEDPGQRQEFIAAYTKYHCYHFGASTFFDIVNDSRNRADWGRSRDRLRLRTISRKRICPTDGCGIAGERGLLFPSTQSDADSRLIEGSDARFASRGMHMWPPEDAPAELYRLLCPSSCSGKVRAFLDDRTLIYSVASPGLPPDHLAINLISFDPMLHIPTLLPLSTSKTPHHQESPFPVALTKPTGSIKRLVKETDPLYCVINRGYWLR